MATQTKTAKTIRHEALAQLPFPAGINLLQSALFEQLQHHYTIFIEQGGEESLHDFRVALRRLRSLLRNYRDNITADTQLIEGLRSLQQLSNRARDLEVFIARLHHYCPEQADWIKPFQKELMEEYQQLYCSLPPIWNSPTPLKDKPIKVTSKKSFSIGQVTRGSGLQQREGLKREFVRLHKQWNEKTIHQLRIRGKRLRYLLEPFDDNKEVAQTIARLKALQDHLGDYRDQQLLILQLKKLENHSKPSSPFSPIIKSLQKQMKQQQKVARAYRHRGEHKRLLHAVKAALQQLAP